MRFFDVISEEITYRDLRNIERELLLIYGAYIDIGINLNNTHMRDERVNHQRNKPEVSVDELKTFFLDVFATDVHWV